jgi:3-oxoacyl-[acyl-carrier protein] reductase
LSTYQYQQQEGSVMNELRGKVAVVTGASKGIGARIAKAYGAAGASVVVGYRSGEEGAERTVKEIEESGGKAVAVRADMANPEEIEQLFAATKQAFGRLDVLVNNAAVYKFEPVDTVTEGEFQRQFDTNVLGPILAAQQAARLFGDEGGSVINIGSVVSRRPVLGSAVYSATKAALDSVTRSLAKELGPRKIRVNSVNPGGTETEGAISAGIIGSDFQKQIVAETPLGRFGQPDDVAQVALFFASDASSWVTGETLVVSGGYD